MDLLYKHHVVLNYYKKMITCHDEEEKQVKIQGIPRDAVVREISTMQMKNRFRKDAKFL
jgi:hypothetical protein